MLPIKLECNQSKTIEVLAGKGNRKKLKVLVREKTQTTSKLLSKLRGKRKQIKLERLLDDFDKERELLKRGWKWCITLICQWWRLLNSSSITIMILALNCQGLGEPHAIQILTKLLQLESHSLVFLSKTHFKTNEFETFKCNTCCNNGIALACLRRNNGRSGGLAMMWNNEWKLKLNSLSPNHMDFLVLD